MNVYLHSYTFVNAIIPLQLQTENTAQIPYSCIRQRTTHELNRTIDAGGLRGSSWVVRARFAPCEVGGTEPMTPGGELHVAPIEGTNLMLLVVNTRPGGHLGSSEPHADGCNGTR